MASELNMYESQVSEYRLDIDRLQREMQEVKKKYFLQKKREQALRYIHCTHMYNYTLHADVRICNMHESLLCGYREKERQSLPVIPANRADMPRFTGGGFNLKQTQKAIA